VAIFGEFISQKREFATESFLFQNPWVVSHFFSAVAELEATLALFSKP
jgi:hypothetical protein